MLLLEGRTARAFVLLQGTAFRIPSTGGHVVDEATLPLRRLCSGALEGSTLEMASDAAAERRRGGTAERSSWSSTSTSTSSRSRRSSSSSRLSMGGESEENRSVEEEWPFHKSRCVPQTADSSGTVRTAVQSIVFGTLVCSGTVQPHSSMWYAGTLYVILSLWFLRTSAVAMRHAWTVSPTAGMIRCHPKPPLTTFDAQQYSSTVNSGVKLMEDMDRRA